MSRLFKDKCRIRFKALLPLFTKIALFEVFFADWQKLGAFIDFWLNETSIGIADSHRIGH